eukprot:sb/3462997/
MTTFYVLGSMVNCGHFRDLPAANKCEFIQTTDSCSDNDALIHYLQFPFCTLPSVIPLADIILFLWTAYLFVCLAITAEEFFCPALTVISKMLRLSQNVAGVTFLALGNGAPDIFSSIVALGAGQLSTNFLALGAMFGAGLFVNTMVIGAVTISQDGFNIARRPFFRDCIFYLGAIYWTWYNCYHKQLNLATAIGYIVLYGVYVALVIVGRFVFQRFIKTRGGSTLVNPVTVDTDYAEDVAYRDLGVADDRESIPIIDNDVEDNIQDDDLYENEDSWTEVPGIKSHAIARALAVAQSFPYLADGTRERTGSRISTAETPLLRPDVSLGVLQRTNSSYEYPSYSRGAAQQVILNFIAAINPLHLKDWDDEFTLKDKIFDVVSVPANLVFTLTIPVVDLTQPLYGWNKLLNALHFTICPLAAVFLLGFTNKTVLSVPVPLVVAVIGVLITAIILLTSSQGENPCYYKPVFTLLGFLMSIMWIYTVASEIVALLSTFGHIFAISSAILGLTVLSWANSVGDLVSDVAMAKQGYPQMAVSACIGGPCLNMLLGIGLASTLSIIKNGKNLELKLGDSLIISSGFLMLTICSHLVAVPLMRFNVRRWYGFYLFGLYLMFLVVAILNITGVLTIHS